MSSGSPTQPYTKILGNTRKSWPTPPKHTRKRNTPENADTWPLRASAFSGHPKTQRTLKHRFSEWSTKYLRFRVCCVFGCFLFSSENQIYPSIREIGQNCSTMVVVDSAVFQKLAEEVARRKPISRWPVQFENRNSSNSCLDKPCSDRTKAGHPGLSYPLSLFLRPHRRRSSSTIFFAPKNFVRPTLPCILRAFSEGLSVRELRTQSRNEEAQREVGWELAMDFWFCGTNPVPNFTGNWHEFCHKFCPEIAPNFSSLFSLPQKSTPNPRHFRGGGEIHANFGFFFLRGFSGCSTLVCVAACGCQYFYADQWRLVSSPFLL